MRDMPSIDRRQFAKQLTVASGAVAAVITASLDQSIAEDRASEKAADEAQETRSRPEAAQPVPQELLLLSLLMRRYPSDHFDEAALKGIVADLRGDIARGAVLSEFGLKNSDEPSSVFRAYRGRE